MDDFLLEVVAAAFLHAVLLLFQVAADPTLLGAKTWLDLAKDLDEAGIELVSMADNLIDRVWTTEGDGRPEILVSIFRCKMDNWE